jgi:5'-nucleotidase
MSRPLALLSNDDGYNSVGILALRDALLPLFDVVVVAPETEQSASSHALSLHRPLRSREAEPGIFAIDGTPADCVYIALHSVGRYLTRRPDVVVSGLNHGLNLGQDVFYSGTVAAAREGALRGIPALATSADAKSDRKACARVAAQIAFKLATGSAVAPGVGAQLLNLNFPPEWRGAVRMTTLGTRVYEELVDVRVDPRGREYLWLGGPGISHHAPAGSDTEAYDQGVASLTPLLLDLTSSSRDLVQFLQTTVLMDTP